MSDKIEEIRITLALNPKQIAERMLSGEVTSESHFVSQEDHLHVASLVDAAHREIVKLRAENERLIRLKKLLDRNEREFLAAIGLATTTVLGPGHDPSLALSSMRLVLAKFEKLRAENERLREVLSWYADQRNHFPVERRSPGDPDPAVVFVEEPPIMSDCGKRARKALEGKP